MFINKDTIYYGNEFHCNVPADTLCRRNIFVNEDLNVKEVKIRERKGSEFYEKIKFFIIQLLIVGSIPVYKPGEGKLNNYLFYSIMREYNSNTKGNKYN